MPNSVKQKNPWERINIKRKARNSLSVPKKPNARRSCSSKTNSIKPIQMTRQHHSQEKVTNEIDASSSTSTNSSDSVVGQEGSSTMEIVQIYNDSESSMDDDEWATDTSVEKMRSAEFLSLDESVIPPPVSFRDNDLVSLVFLHNGNGPIAYSTPRSLPDGKNFPFSVIDSLMEAVPKASSTLRSDVVTQHGEPLAIPNVNYANEFVKESDTLEDEEFQLKSISSEQSMQLPDIPDDVNNERREQREDEDFQLKSISSEKSIQLPDIPEDISNVSQEQREGSIVSNEREDQTFSSLFKKHDYAARRDSFACSEVPSSDGFKISEDSDECTKKNFDEKDDEYIKNNPFSATVINKSTNSNFRERKQEDKVENSSENTDDYSNGQDFGEAQNMQIDSSKKNGKGYRVYNSINESIIRWKQKNKQVNLLEYKSDSEDNFENVQKIQNKDLQDDELDNNQPQTVALQIKRKVKICVGVDNKRQQNASILNRSQSSTSLRRKHRNEGGNLSEDVDKSDSDDSFEINIQNEELQDYESDNNQQKTATHQRKTNNRVKFASILSRSTNSSQKKKHRNKIKNSSEDLNNYNRADNFEEAETPKRMGTLCRGIKLKFSNRKKTPLRRKYTNEGGNLFEDMDKNDSEVSFENVENIQNEELQDDELDNNQPETATHQINRKINKHVGADNITQQDANITNRSQSSTSLRRKHKKERENSFEDMDKSDNEENFENVRKNQNDRDNVGNSSEDNYDRGGNFEEAQNMEINTSKKKRKPYGGVGIKRNRRVNRSRKVVNSLSRSKNSTGREVSEGVQNNRNEAEKINWPRCCLEESETLHFGQTFRILQPVFRDDIPIDSITLVNLGLQSKMKCKH